MSGILRQLFDIRPNERPQVILLSLTFLLFIVGLVWAENTIQAEVVNQDMLPTAQTLGALSVVVASLVYTAFVDRIPRQRMLLAITLMSVVAIAITTVLLSVDVVDSELVYLALYSLHQLLLYFWIIHWGTTIISIYDTRTAKRIFPLLGIMRPLGTTIAGATLGYLTGDAIGLDTTGIMIVWVISLVVVAGLIVVLSRVFAKQPTDRRTRRSLANQASSEGGSSLESLFEGFRYVRQSAFLRWMAVFSLLLIAILALIQFHTTEFMLDYFEGQNVADPRASLRTFTAQLDAVSNFAAMILYIVGFQPLLRRIGLGNMNLLFPVLVLGSTGALILVPVLAVNAWAHIVRKGFRRTFADPVTGLLANAVPVHAKGRARAVIISFISPFGVVAAAQMITFFRSTETIPVTTFVLGLLLVASIAYVIVGWILRRQYAEAMVDMLQSESYSYLLDQQPADFGVVNSEMSQMLLKQFEETTDPDFKLFIASIIEETAGPEAYSILLPVVRKAEGSLKAHLMTVINQSDNFTADVQQLYIESLNDSDPDVRVAALSGMIQHANIMSQQSLAQVQALLQDPDPTVRGLAVSVLNSTSIPAVQQTARETLNELLDSTDSEACVEGILVISRSGDSREIMQLLNFVSHASDMVRLEASRTIEQLWDDSLPDEVIQSVMDHFDELANDPIERVRQVEITLLGHLSLAQAHELLIQTLLDDSPRVRQSAVNALIKHGEAVIPLLRDVSKTSENRVLARRAAEVLTRINPQKYSHVVERHLKDHIDLIYTHHARLNALEPCNGFSGVGILQNTLRQEISQLTDEIFELLAVLTDPESLQVIEDTLRSSDVRTRSNAAEALESWTSPQTARLISPLFEPDITSKQLVALHTDGDNAPLLAYDVLVEFVRREDKWFRAATLSAIGEIIATHPELPTLLPEVAKLRTANGAPIQTESSDCHANLDLKNLMVMVRFSANHASSEVRVAARSALRVVRGEKIIDHAREKEEDSVLSIVERTILLKKVSLFQNIAVGQLRVLAGICEERLFNRGERIFDYGDTGDALYIVVTGLVNIGFDSDDGQSFTQLASYGPNTAFGEMSLFDNSPRSASAVVAEDTLTLRLESEPLTTLIYQYPDLSIELLRALNENLRRANSRIAQLSDTMRKKG